MNEGAAASVMNDARDVFKFKSFNKMYSKSRKNWLSNERADRDMLRTKREYKKELELYSKAEDTEDIEYCESYIRTLIKYESRNVVARSQNYTLDASDMLMSYGNITPYREGEILCARSAGGEEFSSSCGLMSSVACYIAISRHPAFCQAKTYYMSISKPGNHAFCIAGLAHQPTWPSINEMVNDRNTYDAWVLDPWMNIVCRPRDYYEYHSKKCIKWLRDNKRISWEGKSGSRPGWYPTGPDYINSICTSKLDFVPGQ